MRIVLNARLGVLAAALALLSPAAAQAKWLRAESPHFIVYTDSSDGTARSYAQTLEDFDRLLRRLHDDTPGMKDAPKLAIYMLDGRSDLRQVFPQMDRLTAGVYAATPDDTFAVSFKPSAIYGDFIVKHEYYHHFMMQYFPGAYPPWMIEGLAEFYSTAGIYAGKMWVGAPAPGQMGQLAFGFKIPLDELIGKSAAQFSGPALLDYYAEAWLLANYMMVDPARRAQLNVYVQAVRAGQEPAKAWTTAVGEAPADTQKKLAAYLDGHVKAVTMAPGDKQKAEVAVTAMPASADDMLLEGQQLKHGVADDLRAKVLAQIRSDAAKHPGDRLADLVLARAEITIGDLPAAEAPLARRLAADDGDQEARLLLASARMRAGDADPGRRTDLYREADRILVPAVKANQDDYRLLYAYARSRSVEPGYPSENMAQVLLRAVALGPQVASLRFAAASVCAERADFDTAFALLTPLVNDPHDLRAAEMARAEIASIEARKPKAGAAKATRP